MAFEANLRHYILDLFTIYVFFFTFYYLVSPKAVEDGDAEHHPFLGSSTSSTTVPSSGPVRLTPGWEDSTPPFDDILQASTTNLSQPVKDRYDDNFLIIYAFH